MAGDYPPLFTFPVIGWAYAAYKYLFGHNRRPKPILDQLRVFQAAQGPVQMPRRNPGGSNNPNQRDPTLPSVIDEAAQRAAEGRRLLAELDRLAPLAKDAAEQRKLAVKRQQEINRGKIEAQSRESKAREAAFRRSVAQQRTRDTGIYRGGVVRPYTSGLSAGAVLIGDALYQRAMGRLKQHWKRVSHLKLNRRGALASRPLDKLHTRTNRTAAGDAGRSQQSGSGGSADPATRSVVQSAARSGTQPVNSSQTSVAGEESASSQAARQVMGQTTTLPSASVVTSSSPLLQAAQLGASAALGALLAQTPRSVASAASRAASSAATRQLSQFGNPANLPTARMLVPPGMGLTALEGEGVASAASSDPKCRCPKPEKKKKSGPRCTNPIVSRKKDGDLLTTVRKLQCPPSKPK